jgi:hypothetical protein
VLVAKYEPRFNRVRSIGPNIGHAIKCFPHGAGSMTISRIVSWPTFLPERFVAAAEQVADMPDRVASLP